MTQTAVSPQDAPPKPRLLWLDANRVLAALGVILIHSTTDASGQPFSQATPTERIGPALLRAVSELSGSEIFLVFSMFLLAAKLDKRPMGYGTLVREQARKILVPFVAWTVFYALFRLVKAHYFGYFDAIATQLREPTSWLSYFTLGTAQYHLHFMPTLFTLVLLSPLMMGAARFPWLALSLPLFLYVMETIQGWLWGNVQDPQTRYYIDQCVKNLCFSGYGVAGAAIYGIWKKKLSFEDSRLLLRGMLLTTFVAFVGTLVYIASIAKTGQWGPRMGAAFYGHYAMPVLVFLCFMAAQYRPWSERYSWAAKFTLGIYLLHPILIDVFDIVAFRMQVRTSPTLIILLKFALVAPGTLALAYGLSRVPRLGWLIGLDAPKQTARAAQITSPAPAE